MDELQAFVLKFSDKEVPVVSDNELSHISSILLIHATKDTQCSLKVLQCLAYFALDASPKSVLCLETFKRVLDILIATEQLGRDEILDWFVDELRPLLPCIKHNENVSASNALKPGIGISYKEDAQREEWRKRGGLKSIPLFYVVLLHLKNKDISSNLWWITPGILNILDDTNDIEGVKLKGVFLLRVFLEHCFDDQRKWVSFSDLGLFELYRPILLNMCYYLPPSYDSNTSLKVLQTVFPALMALYRLQFGDGSLNYKHHLGKFLSEIILQILIPRVNLTHESLTEYALDIVCQIIQIQKESSAVHLQRIIYVLGEYLVRNPFFTAFSSLLHGTLNVITALIRYCPKERIVAHKYDFLGLLLIIFEKCQQEGMLTPTTLEKLQTLRLSLEAAGCDFDADKREILIRKDVYEFFQ
ncbi:TTI2 (YJR136C) [Zygosaccharomyces parabailii]|uniref:ZYBA0S10-04236g1_1 n=1 Tax=Zygosaccharomyces bailii (strain CLIB 213 / ATCC 58445 / CBS 680 / BCRC 21525 / NBRC 1098 / NCYC 1416 / NRRL Y-2227) TaxID=1333698 RepID=A0A8J2XAK5_ZYGB2|nr:TTI2 (YJR136C) [Zygosaccharomyces parabailii]CDF91301.1 ZYBA0S10-04236g1_1 [Zygosaccharomyces bailii CLIB 213]CDH17071.1 related to TEL2-interacting protein 2 [Zygosaccharomyces bailii ISA1307]